MHNPQRHLLAIILHCTESFPMRFRNDSSARPISNQGDVEMQENPAKYRWLRKRLAVGLLCYALASIVGASLVEYLIHPYLGSHWRILVFLVFVTVCMITERGGWRVWQRALFVIVSKLLQPFVGGILALSLGMVLYKLGLKGVIDPSINLLSALPLILLAMRRSRLFVRDDGTDFQETTPSLAR